MTATFDLLPVTSLTPDPTQARQVRASPEDEASLVASIKERGVLQPLVVRPAANGYAIVFGERRWRAALAAGLEAVPVLVRTDLTAADILADQAAENMVRSGMHPVDKWLAMSKLLGHYDLPTAAAIVGVGEREARKLQKLGSLSPKLLAAMAGSQVPSEHCLSLIAAASHDQQDSALKRAGKWRDGPNWSAMASLLSVSRISRSTAIFDVEAAGVVFEQDLFAEPGTPEEWTTADVEGFLRAQAAALAVEAVTSKGRIVVIEMQKGQYSAEVPRGWRHCYSAEIPKRFKKDDPRKVFAYVATNGHNLGSVVRELYQPLAAKAPRSAGRRLGLGDDASAPLPTSRDPITKAGRDLIAQAKREAVQSQLFAVGDVSDLLKLLLIALASSNVEVKGEPTNSWATTDLTYYLHHLVDADGRLIRLDTHELRSIAAEAIGKIVLFERPANGHSSGRNAEWIGAAVGAEIALPRFDTAQFLGCCAGSVLNDIADTIGIKPLKSAKASRELLIDHAPDWRPVGVGFSAPGPEAPAPEEEEKEGEGEDQFAPAFIDTIADEAVAEPAQEIEGSE